MQTDKWFNLVNFFSMSAEKLQLLISSAPVIGCEDPADVERAGFGLVGSVAVYDEGHRDSAEMLAMLVESRTGTGVLVTPRDEIGERAKSQLHLIDEDLFVGRVPVQLAEGVNFLNVYAETTSATIH